MANTCTYRTAMDEDILVDYYYHDIGKLPCLTPEKEYELAQKARKGDIAARDELLNANLKFVVSVAKEFRGYGMSFADLISEGNIGLINAVDKFEPDKGNKFVTYAVWWIRQSIIKALQDKGRAIRVPANKYTDLMKIKRTAATISGETGEEPDIEELARATAISPSRVKSLLEIPTVYGSLDQPIKSCDGENGGTIADLTPSTEPGPEAVLLKSDRKDSVNRYLNILSEREKNVLKMRYGFDGRPEMSLQAVGNELGLTKERIRQIEQKALTKLRNTADAPEMQAMLN